MNTNVIEYSKKINNQHDTSLEYDKTENQKFKFQELINAGEYREAQSIIRNCFLDYYLEGMFYDFKEIFLNLRSHVIFSNPWFTFYYAVIIKNTKPHIAIHLMKASRSLFISDNDKAGVILSLIQIIDYYLNVNVHYNRIIPILKHTYILYDQIYNKLTIHCKISTNLTLAQAEFYVNRDLDKLNIYNKKALNLIKALKLVKSRNLNSFFIKAFINQALPYISQGSLRKTKKEIEKLFPLYCSDKTDNIQKLEILFIATKTFILETDFENYSVYRKLIEVTLRNTTVEKTIYTPYFYLWDVELELKKGDLKNAEKVIIQALAKFTGYEFMHFRSLFLHYHSLIMAFKENIQHIERTAKESLKMRKKVGGRYHIMKNNMVLGSSYSIAGFITKSHKHLDKAISDSSDYDNRYVYSTALFYKFITYLNADNEKEISNIILNILDLMQKDEIPSFMTWTPGCMEVLFSEAIKRNIKTEFALESAKKILKLTFNNKGAKIPVISVQTFGKFCLKYNGIEVFNIKKLRGNLKKIISILISSPDKRVNSEQLQTFFWPESDTKKGRRNLDVTINRLKAEVSKKLKHFNISHYIFIKKGLLRIENFELDSDLFVEYADKGYKLAEDGSFWQAENCFRNAFKLWKGEYLPETLSDNYNTAYYYSTILQKYKLISDKWCDIFLMGRSVCREDLLLLENALIENSDNIDYIRKMYQIYINFGKRDKALSFIEKHKFILSEKGFEIEEVNNIVDLLWERRKEM